MTSLEALVTELLARVDGQDAGQSVRALSIALAEAIVNSLKDETRARLVAEIAALHMTSAVACILEGHGRDLYGDDARH